MNEQDLRDCFAMFASLRIGLDGSSDVMLASAERCYAFADAMLEARNKVEDDDGIATIKKRKYVRKN
jgi:hypothetical protein